MYASRVRILPTLPTNDSAILGFRNSDDLSYITLSLELQTLENVPKVNGGIQLTIQRETETSHMHCLNHC